MRVQYDPDEELPGTLTHRITRFSPSRILGVWIDGEFVGIGEEVEIRSGPEREFGDLLSVEERAARYVERLESEDD